MSLFFINGNFTEFYRIFEFFNKFFYYKKKKTFYVKISLFENHSDFNVI